MQTVLITGKRIYWRMLTNELIWEGYQVIILSRSAKESQARYPLCHLGY